MKLFGKGEEAASSAGEAQYCVVYVNANGKLAHVCDTKEKLVAKVEEFRDAPEACLIEFEEGGHPFTICDTGGVIGKLLLRART